MKKRQGTGTGTRSTLDTRMLAEALKGPGIDSRHWVSYGTVGTVDDQGNANYSDARSVYVGPEGVEVDVILEPLGLPVTCHYYGVQGGQSVTFLTPIHAGDRVVVILPEGSPATPPVIVAILHSAHDKVPIGDDNLPIFRNDRVFLWTKDVDIDIRTKNGARVDITQDNKVNVRAGHVNLGSDDPPQQLVQGNNFKGASDQLAGATSDWASAVNDAFQADPTLPLPAKLAIAAATAAFSLLISAYQNSSYLSDVSKTE